METGKQLSGTLAIAVFTAALGSLQYGYSLGVINAPQKVIEKHYALSLGVWSERPALLENGTDGDGSSEEIKHPSVIMYWSLSVAIFSIGGMVSSFLVGFIGDLKGRVKGMLMINFLAVAAGLLMGLSRMWKPHIMVISGRAIMGFYCGLTSGLVPMYIGEIAPKAYRGALGTLHQLAIVIGILLSQVIGLDFVLGNDEMWHVLLGLSGAPAILQTLMLPLCPESPRYLYILLGKEQEARKSLHRLKGAYDPSADLEEMRREKEEADREPRVSIRSLVSLCRHEFCRVILLHNEILHLSTSIQCGKKKLSQEAVSTKSTLTGSAALANLCCCLANIEELLFSLQNDFSWMSYVSMVAIFLFVSFFEIGPGPIPWFIVAELFSQGPRPAAIALAGCCNWTSNFIIGMTFPYIQAWLDCYVFILFAVLLLGFTIFIYLRVPETKGKTFEEIAAVFQKKQRIPKDNAELQQLKTSSDA
uniref:Solute carrier family 2 member 2 n=1 Tax=Fundulus heteroclitus TaxID=8078 RepID=A0A3Q2QXT0_FUNHE